MRIIERLSEVSELPTRPEVMMRVQAVVDSDTSGAGEVARVLREDPALAAKILKVANSAFYGGGAQAIVSLELAVTRIGYREIRDIAIALTLIHRFSKRSNLLDYQTFWRHSLAGAFTVRAVGRTIGGPDSPQHTDRWFLAGLLHDMGVLVYDQFFHEELGEIFEYRKASKASQVEAERNVAPLDTHGEVGGVLLDSWRMDPVVVGAVRHHHAPLNAPPEQQTCALAVALTEHLLADIPGAAFEGVSASVDTVIWERLRLHADQYREMLLEAARRGAEKSELLCRGDGAR